MSPPICRESVHTLNELEFELELEFGFGFGMQRRVSEPEKKVVAARQSWQCSGCSKLLEATYQVDHTVALCNGGRDHVNNMSAMCVRCHAHKTQREHIERVQSKIVVPDADYYSPDREDVVIGDGRVQMCVVCGAIRSVRSAWEAHRCPGPGISTAAKLDLAQFKYSPVLS